MKRTIRAGCMTAIALTGLVATSASAQTTTITTGDSAEACSAMAASTMAFRVSGDEIITTKDGNIIKVIDGQMIKDGKVTEIGDALIAKSDDGSVITLKGEDGEVVVVRASKLSADGEVAFRKMLPTRVVVSEMNGDVVVDSKDGQKFHVKRPATRSKSLEATAVDGHFVAATADGTRIHAVTVDGKEPQVKCRIMLRKSVDDGQ